MTLVETLKDQQKQAMRAKDKFRLGTIRLALAAVKQIEVDERKSLTDEETIVILTKLVKQRHDSVTQYNAANREDLAEVEAAEIKILEEFLPQQLSDAELESLVEQAIVTTKAASMRDMGKVMGALKAQTTGRADMGKVSQLVKTKLN